MVHQCAEGFRHDYLLRPFEAELCSISITGYEVWFSLQLVFLIVLVLFCGYQLALHDPNANSGLWSSMWTKRRLITTVFMYCAFRSLDLAFRIARPFCWGWACRNGSRLITFAFPITAGFATLFGFIGLVTLALLRSSGLRVAPKRWQSNLMAAIAVEWTVGLWALPILGLFSDSTTQDSMFRNLVFIWHGSHLLLCGCSLFVFSFSLYRSVNIDHDDFVIPSALWRMIGYTACLGVICLVIGVTMITFVSSPGANISEGAWEAMHTFGIFAVAVILYFGRITARMGVFNSPPQPKSRSLPTEMIIHKAPSDPPNGIRLENLFSTHSQRTEQYGQTDTTAANELSPYMDGRDFSTCELSRESPEPYAAAEVRGVTLHV